MQILTFSSLTILAVSIMLIVSMAIKITGYNIQCNTKCSSTFYNIVCSQILRANMKAYYETWVGFSSATLSSLADNCLGSEFIDFAISNGAQFVYSLH
jgi:hypothetical protein